MPSRPAKLSAAAVFEVSATADNDFRRGLFAARKRTALMTKRTQWNWKSAIQDARTPKPLADKMDRVTQLSAALGT